MELAKFLALLAVVLPVTYGAPTQAAATGELHPKILEAMKRDLGLDADQAHARVAREAAAANIIEQMRGSAGESFAGAWFDADTLHIGVTDEALAGEVTAAGATPIVMTNSLSKLEKAKADLDKVFIPQANTLSGGSASGSGSSSSGSGSSSSAAGGSSSAAGPGIASFFVDVASNRLVIEAIGDNHGRAEELAAQIGLASGEYEVRTVEELPTLYASVQGGDNYFIDNASRCSVGFAVTTGFVSAGHCGQTGSSATTPRGQPLGTFAGSVFPGNADMSYVRTVSGTGLNGSINGYGQGNLPVSGSNVAAVGASVCRSGATTQVHCGTIRARGATINYQEGSVTGLTQTTVCAEQGDSGGSFYAGSQAQGVTSGGNGNCRTGGITYFQPVNEILETFGLTLVTG